MLKPERGVEILRAAFKPLSTPNPFPHSSCAGLELTLWRGSGGEGSWSL